MKRLRMMFRPAPLFWCAMVAGLAALLSVGEETGPDTGDTTPPETPPSPPVSGFIKDGVLDLDAVVAHFEDLYRSDSSYAVMELTVTRPRTQRSMQMEAWSKGQDKALIVVTAPPREKGSATLKVDKNLWNYVPRIKRTIRIPPSMMLASWMGSDFTNDDLVRESSFKDDYEYTLVGRAAPPDPPGWLIRFDAKPDMVGLWNRFELVISEDGLIPLVARYYDRRDRLSRTLTWRDVTEFDGRLIPARMTLLPEDKEGHKTEMVYLNINFEVEISEDMFSLSQLERDR